MHYLDLHHFDDAKSIRSFPQKIDWIKNFVEIFFVNVMFIYFGSELTLCTPIKATFVDIKKN